MPVKVLIPFLSFLLVSMLAYTLQAHAPGWRDFISWCSWVAMFLGGLELVVGLILLTARKKIWARALLLTAIVLLIVGGILSILLGQHWIAPVSKP
ncbi:MAG: hypothetical protein ABIX01_12240 [Chitinophagaceae bacterium]